MRSRQVYKPLNLVSAAGLAALLAVPAFATTDLTITLSCVSQQVTFQNTNGASRVIKPDIGFRGNCAPSPDDSGFQESAGFSLGGNSSTVETFSALGLGTPACPS